MKNMFYFLFIIAFYNLSRYFKLQGEKSNISTCISLEDLENRKNSNSQTYQIFDPTHNELQILTQEALRF